MLNIALYIPPSQSAVIRTLYDPLALQCKNCGLRYAVTETMAFSAHLDWHFRMRRRERDNARRAQSRAWYFERIDWIISEEIEDDEKGEIIHSAYTLHTLIHSLTMTNMVLVKCVCSSGHCKL